MQKNAILYLRVSTDEQADKGYSLQYQEERLIRYCALHDISVITQFKEDHSAKTFDRPEFKRMMNFCKKNHRGIDLLLFINWSRFSRNAGDSYAMINQFQKLNIEPQAIEQPLDLNIPENKMMLAFYLAAPEVENDRRSINVIAGMRRAKKEGRWMATAPMGYKNTRDENGKAIIPGPRADLIREAFEEFSTGVYTMEDLRLRLGKKGLKCSKNQFPAVLRNPVYIGKIYLPAYKDEEAQYVKGIHEPLVSETLFYLVQEIMEGRRPNMPSTITKRDELPLRGYLVCKRCGTNLTGSASKGNGGKYFYYHCQHGCKERSKAEEANEAFFKLLRSIKAKPEVLNTYQEVLEDVFHQSRRENLSATKRIKDEIEKIEPGSGMRKS